MTRIATALAFLLFSASAQAQTCAPSKKFQADLVKAHGEKPVVQLVQPNGAYLVVLINPEKENCSVLNVRPSGLSCLIGAGIGYVNLMPVPGEAS